MKNSEIRRLIRKLSRRRHRHLKYMLYYMRWPTTYRTELTQYKSSVQALGREIDGLIAKL